jgi:hypothetical protein
MYYINYSTRYYLYYKLYLAYINYLFIFITQKFIKASMVLKLKKFELTYDIIKVNDSTRYKMGINPRLFMTTLNKRARHKRTKVIHIVKDLTRLLNDSLRKNEIKGYYIRIKGRFKRGRRKAKIVKRNGTLPFNTINIRLNSCFGLLHTRFGIAGIRIIFSY